MALGGYRFPPAGPSRLDGGEWGKSRPHSASYSQRCGWALLTGSLLLAVCGSLHGQTAGTGAIQGRILDPSGAAVPNAQVTVANTDMGTLRVVRSNPAGIYDVSLLPPGRYSVRVEAPGFEQAGVGTVRVVVTETTSLDILLKLGSNRTEVRVSAAVPLAQTRSAALGSATDASIITALPLANRNFTQILALSPGVTVELPDAGALGRNNQNVTANGARATADNFQFNGIDANNIAENSASGSGGETGLAIPAPDTIAEFKVQTGLYDAAYGRDSGANVDMISKAGSNTLHGDVWEFLRNESLNANDFFLNLGGNPRPELKQNQFGFTVGGPIEESRTFFFIGYEGQIQRNGESSLSLINSFLPPLTNDRSAAGLGQEFKGQAGALGGTAVAEDGSNINPVALALLNLKFPNGNYVIPNPQVIVANGVGEATFSSPAKFRSDQYTLNLDHRLTARDQLAARSFYSRDRQSTPFGPFGATIPGWGQNLTAKNAMLVLSDTQALSPRLANAVRFGYMRFDGLEFTASPITSASVGITPPTGLPGQPPDLPLIIVSGLFSMGPGSVQFSEVTNDFIWEDTLSYTLGRHSFRTGAEVKRTQLNINSPFSTNGLLIFLSFPDFLLGQSAAQNGSGVSNVFLSNAASGSFALGERYTDFAGFGQDTYQVSGRLTLTAGVRYEFFGPPSEIRGRLPNFDPTIADPNPPATGTLTGLVLPSNYAGPLPAGVLQTAGSGLWQKDFGNFAPRLGFALQFHSHPDLVLRGGYGIYYQRLSAEPALNDIGTLPFAISVLQSGAINAAATFQVPFSPPLPVSSSFPIFVRRFAESSLFFPGFSRSAKSPYLQEYGLNLQAAPTANLLWQIGYVGSHGSRLTGCVQFNQAELATPQNPVRGLTTSTLENLAERVPILGVGGGSLVCETSFFSNYNSLQTSLTKRFSGGLSFLGSYTWSRSLDVTSGGGNSSAFDLNFITNDQTNPDNAYGPSDFDRTQRFVLSLVEQPPKLEAGPRIGRQILSNWQFTGILVFQSGLPITVVDSTGGTIYGNAVSAVRAECTGADPASAGSVTSRLNGYFNPAAFAPPPIIGDGTGFGSCGTGIVRGPDQRNLDFGVERDFPIGEARNMQFRAEIFNFTNTPKFGLPVHDFSSPAFGVISSTVSNPRIVQLALKLNF